MGVGMVLRNDAGEFLVCRSRLFAGIAAVYEGEALGLYEALSWIRELGVQRIIFEMNAKKITDVVSSHSVDCSEFGSIVNCCKLLVLLVIWQVLMFGLRHRLSFWLMFLTFVILALLNNIFCCFLSKKKKFF